MPLVSNPEPLSFSLIYQETLCSPAVNSDCSQIKLIKLFTGQEVGRLLHGLNFNIWQREDNFMGSINSVTKAHCVMFGSEKFYNLHSFVKYTLNYTPSYFSDFWHLQLRPCHCYTSQAPPTYPKPPLALPHWKALPYTLPQLPGNSRTLLPVCVDIFHPV